MHMSYVQMVHHHVFLMLTVEKGKWLASSFTLKITLPLRKEPQYPLTRELYGSQSLSVHCGKYKNPALGEINPSSST